MAKDFSMLVEAEAANGTANQKPLGYAADLLWDLDAVYFVIAALVKSPGGDTETSDELLAFLAITRRTPAGLQRAPP